MVKVIFAVSLILLSAASQSGAQTLELDISDSALGSVPSANGYTAVGYYEPLTAVPTLFTVPRPQRMFAGQISYFVKPKFAVYASYAWTRKVSAEASETFNGTNFTSVGVASQRLTMFNAGAMLSTSSGFFRPYGYAGVGFAPSNYAWSTKVVEVNVADSSLNPYFTQSGKSPVNANFQIGGGFRLFPKRWIGTRVFGEVNLQPGGLENEPLDLPSSSADFFVRVGIGLFIRPFGH